MTKLNGLAAVALNPVSNATLIIDKNNDNELSLIKLHIKGCENKIINLGDDLWSARMINLFNIIKHDLINRNKVCQIAIEDIEQVIDIQYLEDKAFSFEEVIAQLEVEFNIPLERRKYQSYIEKNLLTLSVNPFINIIKNKNLEEKLAFFNFKLGYWRGCNSCYKRYLNELAGFGIVKGTKTANLIEENIRHIQRMVKIIDPIEEYTEEQIKKWLGFDFRYIQEEAYKETLKQHEVLKKLLISHFK